MRESLMYGSVRGTRGNSRPYRNPLLHPRCCTCSGLLLALKSQAGPRLDGLLSGVLRTMNDGRWAAPEPRLFTPSGHCICGAAPAPLPSRG